MLGYQLISDVTVSGSAVTSVDFTGLNITKDDDYMIVSNGVYGGNEAYNLYVNGNYTNANYYSQLLQAGGASVIGARYNYPAFLSFNTFGFSNTRIKLTNNGYYTYKSSTIYGVGGSSPYLGDYFGTSTFTATSITQLTIKSANASGIGIGSRFQLYKCVATKVADITVGTATTSVDITGLSIDKTSEYMLVSDVVNAGTGCDYSLFVNANTTPSNYYNQLVSANSTAIAGARTNNAAITNVATSAKNCVTTNIKLTNNGYFTTQSKAIATYGGSSVYLLNKYETSIFTATSITSLTITSATATQIAAGSRFQLYKLK